MNNHLAEISSLIRNRFKNTTTPSKLDWIILATFCVVLFSSHIYWDLIITTKHSVNFWYALEQGKLLNFYSFNIDATPSNPLFPAASAGYDFIVYVVFAIWNFPLWVLERFFDVNIFTALPCLLWAKAILLPFLFATAVVVFKTCKELKISTNHAKWAVYIFMSSGFVFSSLFLIGQYDIISIFITMLGLLMYIKGHNKRFVLLFAIAISFKLFALLIFIPLVLLKEKRVMRIMVYGLVAISLTVIQKAVFLLDQAMGPAQEFASQLVISKLFHNRLEIGLEIIYIYIFAFVGLCIFCYVKNLEDQDEANNFSIYIPFASMALLFMLTPAYPYWMILLTPYFPILLFLNTKHFKLNLLLDTILSASMIIAYSIIYFWCYGIKTIEPMLIPRLFGAVSTLAKPLSANDLYLKIMPASGTSVLLTIFTVCLTAILVINYPNRGIKTTDVIIERSVIWARMLICAGICCVPLLMYFGSLIVYGVIQ